MRLKITAPLILNHLLVLLSGSLVFVCLFRPHPQHMDVPRPGTEAEPQPQPPPQGQQHGILNPLAPQWALLQTEVKHVFYFNFFNRYFISFWPRCAVAGCGISVPRPGIESRPQR